LKKGKPAGVQLLVRAVVRDPDGKIITDTERKPAKSFLIQFLEFIAFMILGESALATATDGTEDVFYSSIQTSIKHFNIKAPLYEDGYGIVVGTGDTAATNTDYVLETQLTEGVGAGNITHGEGVVGAAAVVGANVDLEILRAFTNSTGSLITVKEAGVYVEINDMAYIHCIVRDVLGAEVEVPDKCSLTVIYTVRTTV